MSGGQDMKDTDTSYALEEDSNAPNHLTEKMLELNQLRDMVSKNEKMEINQKQTLLKEIDEVEKREDFNINELKSFVREQMEAYEQQNREEKEKEEKKKIETMIQAAGMDEIKEKMRLQQNNLEIDDTPEVFFSRTFDLEKQYNSDIINSVQQPDASEQKDQMVGILEEPNLEETALEFERKAKQAMHFVNGVTAFETVRNGVQNWIVDVEASMKRIENDAGKDVYQTEQYQNLKTSIEEFKRILHDDAAPQKEVTEAFLHLNNAALTYMKQEHSSKNKTVTTCSLLAKKIVENIELLGNTYDNARRAIMFGEKDGKISYADLPAGDVLLRARELQEKFHLGGPDKEYDFEKMKDVSKEQITFKKKIRKISPTLAKHYEPSQNRNKYMDLKKDIKITDFARYFVCSRHLDKMYDAEKSLAENPQGIDSLKALNQSFDASQVRKEMDALAKNPLFKNCLKSYGKKAFTEWAKIEDKSDALKVAYQSQLQAWGGNDVSKLTDVMMQFRTGVGSMLESQEGIEHTANRICQNLGIIVALQVLTDPKARTILNEAAMTDMNQEHVLFKMIQQTEQYLQEKGFFKHGAGADAEMKCRKEIQAVLKSDSIKTRLMSHYMKGQKQNAKKVPSVQNIKAPNMKH